VGKVVPSTLIRRIFTSKWRSNRRPRWISYRLRLQTRELKDEARVTWKEASPGLRGSAILLWALGTVIGLIGLLGDVLGWWDGLSFLTNLVSSLTGAMIGIPIAVIILQRITAKHAQRLAQAATRQRVAGLAGTFSVAVRQLWLDPLSDPEVFSSHRVHLF
jgi:hypothetical protein